MMIARSLKKSNNPRITKKERNLLKGAIRRVFSRSELRQKVVHESIRPGYYDDNRPRVKKWSICALCQTMVPTYLVAVDHISPIIPVDRDFERMSIDEVVDRVWSEETNLQALCESCHDDKTKAENKQRRLNKKAKQP